MFNGVHTYLQKHCPTQDIYQNVLDQLKSIEQGSPKDMQGNKILEIWKACKSDSSHENGLSSLALGVRCFLLMEYGIQQGWISQRRLETLKKIIRCVKFFIPENTPLVKHEILDYAHEQFAIDFTYKLPHSQEIFYKIMSDYLEENNYLLCELSFKKLKIKKIYYNFNSMTESTSDEKMVDLDLPSLRISTLFEKFIRSHWIFPTGEKAFSDLINRIHVVLSQYCSDLSTNVRNKDDTFIATTCYYACRGYLSKDKAWLHLLITDPNLVYKSGSYKKVLKAQRFSMMTGSKAPAKEAFKCKPFVKYVSIISEEASELAAAELMRRIGENCPTFSRVKHLYFGVDENFEVIEPKRVEVYAPWYNSNLWEAAQTMSIPLDFSNTSEKRIITYENLLQFVVSVAKDLRTLHQFTLHRDIKSTNILIKIKKNGAFKVAIIDYDFAEGCGEALNNKITCPHWDSLASDQWATPLTDWYGLAYTIGFLFIPGLNADKIGVEKIITSDQRSWFFWNWGQRLQFKINLSDSPGESSGTTSSSEQALRRELRNKLSKLEEKDYVEGFNVLRKTLETFLSNHYADLSKDIRDLCYNWQCQIDLMEFGCDVVKSAMDMDNQIYLNFKRTPTAKDIFRSGSRHDREQLFDSLSQNSNFMLEFFPKLEALQTQLNIYKKNYVYGYVSRKDETVEKECR